MGFNSLLQYKARVLLIVEGHNMTQYKAKKEDKKPGLNKSMNAQKHLW